MKTLRLIAAACVVLLLTACGARPALRLNRNGSGRFDMKLQLARPFVDYLLDLGEVTGMFESRDKAVLFDLPVIKKILTRYPGVKVNALTASPAGDLALSLSFTDVTVFTRAGGLWPDGSPLTYTTSPEHTLRLRLDKTVMNGILTSFFNFKSSELEVFLPREKESRAEYEENLDFALDGGAKLFRDSSIAFQVTVDGTIVKHNGALQSKNTVQFDVPLGTLLFLEKPVEYYIVFK